MKISEKVEIVSTTLVIIAIFTLLQSSLLNTISVIVGVGLLYRYGHLKLLETDAAASTVADPDIGTRPGNAKRGVISSIIDNLCSIFLYLELLSLPMLVLYLASPYQTFNCVFGLILGIICTKVMHGKILGLMRIWVWFITFNLSLASVMVIIALSRSPINTW